MPQTFTSREVTELIKGMTQRKREYWDSKGLVSPSGSERNVGSKRRGRGDRRLYSFQDLLKVRVVQQLRENGLSLQKIQDALKALKKRKPSTEPFDEVLVTDGKRFVMQRADGKVEDLLGRGQLLITAFEISSLEKELEKKIVKMEKQKKLASA